MTARRLLLAAMLCLSGGALAQSDKEKAGGSKLETAGTPIPEKCAGLTGEKRQQCIKEHGGKSGAGGTSEGKGGKEQPKR